MNRKIYFHVDEGSMPLELEDSKFERAKGYKETEALIERGVDVIHTTSMAHLSFDLIDLGYEIYLRYRLNEFRVYPGMSLPPTGKELRRPHNIRKLFLAHCFDYVLGIEHIIGYYTYGDLDNIENVRLAFERKGYTLPTIEDMEDKRLFFYTLPNCETVSYSRICNDSGHDNALVEVFKQHQGYEQLLIPEREITPIFKAGDKIYNCVQLRKIMSVDIYNQCYTLDDGIQLEFSEQDQWKLALPIFKEGDRIKKIKGDDAVYTINIVDCRSGMKYAVSWWEDGEACSKLIEIKDQDQYELISGTGICDGKSELKAIEEAIKQVECLHDEVLAKWLKELLVIKKRTQKK